MVRPDRAVEADLLIRFDGRFHIGRPLVVPRLHEVALVALDVSEVNEVDPVAELADRLIRVAVHRGEVPLTERDAVPLAVVEIEDASVVRDRLDDPRDAADRRRRRVVGVKGEVDAVLLGDGDDLVEEVFEVVPQLRFGDPGGLVVRGPFGPLVVVADAL